MADADADPDSDSDTGTFSQRRSQCIARGVPGGGGITGSDGKSEFHHRNSPALGNASAVRRGIPQPDPDSSAACRHHPRRRPGGSVQPVMAPEEIRQLLCALGDHIQSRFLSGRASRTVEELSGIAAETAADTIYQIDRLSEEAIAEWFSAHWPPDEPVQVVMEGIEDDDPLCFPKGIDVSATHWKCIIDPIDGTREIMHDKRSAWTLAGVAPQKGDDTCLSDIVAAAMTELPVTKQWRADQISASRGGGCLSTSRNVLDGSTTPLQLQPSRATNFEHGFSWLAKYLPEGRTLTSQIEEALWEELTGYNGTAPLPVFDDQYISTGGAFYEMLSGHDRFGGDIRPLIFARLGLDAALVCHPYDVSAALILAEAGIIYEHPLGGFPDAPLNTTHPMAWVIYANPAIAAKARPVLQKLLNRFLA